MGEDSLADVLPVAGMPDQASGSPALIATDLLGTKSQLSYLERVTDTKGDVPRFMQERADNGGGEVWLI